MIGRALRALFPPICLLCDQSCGALADADLCVRCRPVLPWNPDPCPRCALPRDNGNNRCQFCDQNPLPVTRTVAPLLHTGYPRHWVHRLKFHEGMVEGRLLAALLADAVRQSYARADLPDVLVPVPAPPGRLARRGHNQAVTIAAFVGRRLDLPLARRGARRARSSRPQRGLSRAARLKAAAGIFESRPWRGETIAVIDDVMTTGATVAELARTLVAAGASEVHVWSATRAV
jgi:ComF family protein